MGLFTVTMDEAYFRNYCGHGPYDENYLFHSGIEHCISIARRLGIHVKQLLVLGAATGRVLEHFESAWGVRAWGCEISSWAHARIPGRFRRRIACADMRDYVPRLVARKRHFDLLFTNSLIYVAADELPDFVWQCSVAAAYLHFYSSTTESFEAGDAYRVTLESNAWWRSLFVENGFEPTRSPYVWRSREAARA